MTEGGGERRICIMVNVFIIFNNYSLYYFTLFCGVSFGLLLLFFFALYNLQF